MYPKSFLNLLFEFLRRNFLIWEVPRKKEFAPLKNGVDAPNDNPKTCREAVMEQHAKWLEINGCTFLSKQRAVSADENQDFANDPLIEVEISPLVSYDGEVREKFSNNDFYQNVLSLYLIKGLKELIQERTLNDPLVIERDPTSKRVLFNGLDFESYRKASN
jgi:hypothetical protein